MVDGLVSCLDGPGRSTPSQKPSNHFKGGWVGPRGYLDWFRKSTTRTMIQSTNQTGCNELLYLRHEAGRIEVHLHNTLSTRRTSVVNMLLPY